VSHSLPNATQARDSRATRRRELLQNYLAAARDRGPRSLAMAALRHRSLQMRDILALAATGDRFTWTELRQFLATQEPVPLEPDWAAHLAYAVGLQQLQPDDVDVALELYDRVLGDLPANRHRLELRKTYVELLLSQGEAARAQRALRKLGDLRELEDDYLWVDSLNPAVSGSQDTAQEWLLLFQERFTQYGLEAPILSDDDAPTPYDALRAQPSSTVDSGPLISVVMTSYRPNQTLLHSVRSVLGQSWTNLEIVLIDDASPAEYTPVLEQAVALDPARVRLVRQDVNRGTYVARNVALAHVRGEVVTGQDSDDWSHPRRLERQVQPLLADESLTSTVSRAWTMSDQLVNFRPGRTPSRANASSLMFRRSVLDVVGGFDETRKGGDSEFMERLSAATRKTFEVAEPLAIIRIVADSLSRSDFRPGWRHEARRSYVAAYRRWHSSADLTAVGRLPRTPRPFALPPRFAPAPAAQGVLDVVVAADWRRTGTLQSVMLDEVQTLRAAGLRVGVLQLPAPFAPARGRFSDSLEELLTSGDVDEVFLDDKVAVRLLMVRYPPVLQLPPAAEVQLDAQRVVIVAPHPPGAQHATGYVPEDCSDHAEHLFGMRPQWVAQNTTVRETLTGVVPAEELATGDLPGVVNLEAWWTERESFRADRPVIGCHADDAWPADAVRDLCYPADGSVDVRLMGRGLEAGRGSWPPPWVVFPHRYLDPRTFLSSLDFFVPDHRFPSAFAQATVQALAAGCVAVLPPQLEPTFGPAAVYATGDEVIDRVWQLYGDLPAYRAQAAAARAYVAQHFAPERYVARVRGLLEHGAAV